MSHREKHSRTSKLEEKVNSQAPVVSKNSSISTNDNGLHSSRINRAVSTESEGGLSRRRGSDSNHSSSVKVTRQPPAQQRPREVFRSMPTEEMSEYASSDNMSTASDRSRFQNHNLAKPQKVIGPQTSSSIKYHGATISQAASQGNLPLCVLLWGMATAKRVRLMDPDSQGDTPMHFAALADLPEVSCAGSKLIHHVIGDTVSNFTSLLIMSILSAGHELLASANSNEVRSTESSG